MKILWILTLGSFAVLGAAAVWMGGLNQDEGWYLYAANLVAEGKVPYRDFFYTQGPLLSVVYSPFAWVWQTWGMLGARIFTLLIGAVSVIFTAALARRLAPSDRRNEAALLVLLLLGANLYHVYYLTIPKTYALASLFVSMGFYLLSVALSSACGVSRAAAAGAGLCLAFAAGTRISLSALLAMTGLSLLLARRWKDLFPLCIGGFAGLALVYGPCLVDSRTLEGLLAAQRYHAARGGFDPVWTVGSLSRLVRWYLPTFVVVGLYVFESRRTVANEGCSTRQVLRMLLLGFLAVFAFQMLAPFPYEDYQVPIIGLLAVFGAVGLVRQESNRATSLALMTLGMAFACSFGSPLLEKWATNGQDRFWSLKKSTYELPQLRRAAAKIEAIDPGGKDLLTQDLYLAIETGRKVPNGLEMGPFSMLTDGEWRDLLESAPCRIAALSGYTFAIKPPECAERPLEQQMEYWEILKRRYELADREDAFGQNATTLLILKRK